MIPDTNKSLIYFFNPVHTNLNSCIILCDKFYYTTLILEVGVQAVTPL